MKSFKQRTLNAQADLIRRYERNEPPKKCPFCRIYRRTCTGCFLSENSMGGCGRFDSSIYSNLMDKHTEEERLARAAFHRKVRKMLLKRPAKYFTPKGWKYLDIPREW